MSDKKSLRGADSTLGENSANQRLFAETLAVDDFFPIEFVTKVYTPALRRSVVERTEQMLTALRILEDRTIEGIDDGGADPALQRLDAKVNLLLDMVGEWLRAAFQAPPEQALRWSRNGVRIDGALLGVVLGSVGCVRFQLSPRLPHLIEIPAVCVGVVPTGEGSGQLWLEFDSLGDSLSAAIDRHLFRLHRREVAEARRVG